MQLVFSGDEKRRKEALAVAKALGSKILVSNFNDGGMKEDQRMIDKIASLIEDIKPGMILTHWSGDYHQDHRAVSYATQAACRGLKLWLWQYPDNSFAFMNDAFNVTLDIHEHLQRKVDLLNLFKSQRGKFYTEECKKLSKEFFKISANL
jgi:LmbE family N-acetylglucosaminyl deacetylase